MIGTVYDFRSTSSANIHRNSNFANVFYQYLLQLSIQQICICVLYFKSFQRQTAVQGYKIVFKTSKRVLMTIFKFLKALFWEIRPIRNFSDSSVVKERKLTFEPKLKNSLDLDLFFLGWIRIPIEMNMGLKHRLPNKSWDGCFREWKIRQLRQRFHKSIS